MPRWMKVARGLIVTGLTFAAGVGVVSGLVAVSAWMLTSGNSLGELLGLAARTAVIAFPVGAAFSGVLALTAGDSRFERLSLARFAAMGAGGGLLVFLLLALNAFSRWSPSDAIANLVILILMGAAAATATLLVARRAGKSIRERESVPSLGEGDPLATQPIREGAQPSRTGSSAREDS
ncbi:MAG: putative rane protein [Gemmatimonadetes bacterium]|nr:putative rane protein [Gemmatimonadota bacterium]